ncbi:integrase_H2C2 domain-containing protein [Trichonephila clavipes]|nr:integrase_H2C2 domain-containing protein [Trichonephila clavipes]
MTSLTHLKRLTVLHFTYDVQVDKSLLGSCAQNRSIVLAWIKKPLSQLKTFGRNRVSIIQELPESDFWKHLNSENNPVDILSRGISPNKIQHCELWWFGPPFLHQYKELEPYDITAVEGDDLFLQEFGLSSMCLIKEL